MTAPTEGRHAETIRGEATRGEAMDVASVIALTVSLLSGVLLLFGLYVFAGSTLAQHRAQDLHYAQLKKDLALAQVPVSGVIARGTPLGVVSIPALQVDQVFEMGSSSEQTLDGPGLRSDTVLPGQAGVSVLVGRRIGGGAPFLHLGRLRPGDTIEVTTGQGRWTYVVDVVRTSDAGGTSIREVPARLTLVTSDPPVLDTRTLQVSAVLKGTALPASTGAAAGVGADPADQPDQGQHDHLLSLLLWSQALLVLAVAATWAAHRFPRRAVWLGAVPVLLVVLWNVFEQITLRLPNTL
ncbi:sortase [Nocardioides ultimimeridianus]